MFLTVYERYFHTSNHILMRMLRDSYEFSIYLCYVYCAIIHEYFHDIKCIKTVSHINLIRFHLSNETSLDGICNCEIVGSA